MGEREFKGGRSEGREGKAGSEAGGIARGVRDARFLEEGELGVGARVVLFLVQRCKVDEYAEVGRLQHRHVAQRNALGVRGARVIRELPNALGVKPLDCRQPELPQVLGLRIRVRVVQPPGRSPCAPGSVRVQTWARVEVDMGAWMLGCGRSHVAHRRQARECDGYGVRVH